MPGATLAGNQHAYAASYVKCYAHITAKLFVKSLIGAVAKAKCGKYSHDVDAYAGVIAEVYADLEQYEYCDTDSYAVIHGHGNGGYNHAGGHSSGGAYTDSVRCSHCTHSVAVWRLISDSVSSSTGSVGAGGCQSHLHIHASCAICSWRSPHDARRANP